MPLFRSWPTMQQWLLSLAAVFLIIGAAFVVSGSAMQAYRDPAAAQLILSGTQCELGIPNRDANYHCDNKVWHRSLDSLRTNKWRFVDAGMGLLASGLTFVIFVSFCRLFGCETWADLRTPKRSISILALAGVAWLMQIPAYWIYYFAEVAYRDCCPWWADSLGIPAFETLMVFGGLFLPYMAIWLFIWIVFIFRSRLPATFFPPASRQIVFIWSAAALLLLAPLSLYLGYAILNGPVLMVPFLWLSLWLVMCARAAALSRHAKAEARGA